MDLKELKEVYENIIKGSSFVAVTPLIEIQPNEFSLQSPYKLYFKNEGIQATGSFKIRGVVSQFANIPSDICINERKLITMSAGNYGRSFAKMCNDRGLKGLVLLPNTAPEDRQHILKDLGVETESHPSCDLMSVVNNYVLTKNMVFMHSFDDYQLIKGYGSIGFEILSELPDVDIVLVCCGGGGLLSGVAAALKLGGAKNCKVYGVEPETANTMWQSFQKECPVTDPNAKSVAAGLAPPFAGTITYELCRQYVDGILLVTDDEILHAAAILNHRGFRTEASGAAAFAALLTGKLPDVGAMKGDCERLPNVVVLLTGSNLSVGDEEKFEQYLHKK